MIINKKVMSSLGALQKKKENAIRMRLLKLYFKPSKLDLPMKYKLLIAKTIKTVVTKNNSILRLNVKDTVERVISEK